MQRRVLTFNLAIIVALSALYFYESSVKPVKVEIGDLSKHVGEYVEVEGIVLSVSDGAKSAKITDENFKNNATIYSDFQLSLTPGSKVVARGVVEKYRDIYEISLKSEKDIEVKSDSLTLTLPILLENPQRYSGLNVRIFGHAIYWKLIYLNVTDGEDYAHLYVYGDYEGEKKTHFYGTIKNGMFHMDNPLNSGEYRDVKIGEIKRMKEGKVRVYGWIVGYYGHLIISQQNWSINVYYYGSEIPKGDMEIKGEFIYDHSRGEYEILSANEN